MNLLNDIITYVRRIVKTPSNTVLSNALIIDYINRFWIMDVDARIQLFDLKKKYKFLTTPGFDRYNMPLYAVQTELAGSISYYPVYQGFTPPAYVNGIEIPFFTQEELFFNAWPSLVLNLDAVATGDGTNNYTINLPIGPNQNAPQNPPYNNLLRGHVDMQGIIASGLNLDPILIDTPNLNIPWTSIYPAVYFTALSSTEQNMVVCDSGQFLNTNANYGLLISQNNAPFVNNTSPGTAYNALAGGYSTTVNTINYLTGVANVTFPSIVDSGNNINAKVVYLQAGLPRSILFYNNTLTLRSVPANQYVVEIEGYLSPAAFLSTADAVPYAYMSEYLARGAARKILSDTGDIEQFQFYEPLFREQEILVWKRSQRQFTSTRTQTIYSRGNPYRSYYNYTSLGGI